MSNHPVEGDVVRLVHGVSSDFRDEVIPAGTCGHILEVHGDPEEYVIEVAIPDPSLIGDYRYDTLAVTRDAFVVEAAPTSER